MKRILALVLALIMLCAFPIGAQAATKLKATASPFKISKSAIKMYVKQSTKLTIKYGSTKISNRKAKLSSSKKSVATVSKTGVITAKKKGICIITAKVNGKKYKCKITVKDVKSSTVYITNTGKRYHRLTCRTLKSVIKTTIKKAQANGYTACKICKP